MRNTTFVNDTSLLAMSVLDEINGLAVSGGSFSAYNITSALRRKHPNEEIDHRLVRKSVHTLLGSNPAYSKDSSNGYIEYMLINPLAQSTQSAQGRTLEVKSERRVCVPDDMVYKAGFTIGQKVFVHGFGSTFTINTTPSDRSLTVDNHKNIRLRTYLSHGEIINCQASPNEIKLFT